MKKIIPLIFSVLYVLSSNAQAVGGWGTCEFADVATMNAFDPSTNAYDCKKVFVQDTDEHYNWDGSAWVLIASSGGTDDQNASEVPFTPVATIVATDVQAAIAEIEPDIYGSIGVHSNVDITTTPPSNGDLLSWNGTNFVPLSSSSLDNIYTVDGTLGEDRTMEMDGNNLIFDGTGSGDVVIESSGNIGIGNTNPDNPLHISEQGLGTSASATNGTIFLEHATGGGANSIVFESAQDAGSDYGYIEYSDDGSGNGSTTQNSLLVIGTQSDAVGINQDDIAIMPSGHLGVGTTTPDAKLTVSNGKVKFTDYGTGATIGLTPTYYLGVTATGELVELSSTGSFASASNVNVSSINFGNTDQHNWTPAGFTTTPFYNAYRITCSSNVEVTGINSSGVVDGQTITLMNIGNRRLRFTHQDTNSTAANRILTPQGNNKDVNNGEVITFIYDATSARWRVFSTGN